MQQAQPLQEARLHVLDYWRVIKTRKAVVFAVFLLVMLVVTTITLLKPKLYLAITRIKVEQERPTVQVFENQAIPSYDPYFLQTQYEIIQSQKILHPVIERLNLMKVWADRHQPLAVASIDVAFMRLKNQISVRRFRDTSLIEISVLDEDPQLAAVIANTIADVFERERLEVKRQQVLKGLHKLRDQLVEQHNRLEAAQAKVEKLRKELEVPVITTGAAGGIKLSDQTLQQLENQLTAARVEAVGREARLKELKKLTPSQLRNAIATLISDPNVQSLLQNLTDTETKLEAMKEDFGPEHPLARAALTTRDKLLEQLDARCDGIIRGFEVDYQMAQARVAELQRQLDEAKSASLVLEGEKYLPFRNAQREEEDELRTYQALKARIEQVSIETEVPRSPVEVIDRAEPPRGHDRPRVAVHLLLGAFVGVFMGVGLTFFLEFLDTSIKKMEDVERFLGLPVLGVVARESELITRGNASPQHIESYRMLRTNIEFARGPDASKSLAVLSAGAGEGKSFTITNLASVFAQHGARVLVVDSDLRRPNIHKNLGLPNTIGLTDYLSGEKTVDEIILPTNIPNLFCITAGGGQTKSALPLLTSQRMKQLIEHVSKQFDVVLYDTPPVLAVSDAAVVTNEVGCSIMVIQHRRYPRAMSLRAKQAIENAGGKLLGVVVNNVAVGQDENYYYYHDHYDRYLETPETSPKRPAPGVAAAPKPSADEVEWQGKY